MLKQKLEDFSFDEFFITLDWVRKSRKREFYISYKTQIIDNKYKHKRKNLRKINFNKSNKNKSKAKMSIGRNLD